MQIVSQLLTNSDDKKCQEVMKMKSNESESSESENAPLYSHMSK